MKTFSFFSTLFLATLFSVSVFAQTDKKADEILKGVSQKYKSFTSLKADFSYTIDNPKETNKETQNGVVSLKGDKYVLQIKGQEVISDGKTVWTFLKESNEVQISEPTINGEAVTPANIFTMYEKGFDYRFVEEKADKGKTYSIIELTPQDKKKNYFKIRLSIDKNEKIISSLVVFEKNGSHYTYTIKQFTPNASLTDASFVFDKSKHPGVEVVDLR